ncbi:tRNA pseudouridine(38-40) synthase TruA [Acetohalobium arabaticum]|uniref:tRNA pseudouridine synthase A n=1 Tax=Acetohalobium arabaticum (strain ATCC 49924 / DSM 5501 / Z-7288) TaxID=574087 RepID=D9QTI1_ACEAZ|nr:tRNA pseudouridine(38-40) synthase TruA [Acetohalobium arabaticum]ADL11745.1 tRNA pseudouridine synthase A [Acetohalobium arabaticum DSM 5501]
MRYLKAIIAYDGTNYYGFQHQPDVPTIQDELEESLRILTKEKNKVIVAGRTDRGVHAQNQVINFKTESPIPLENIRFAWNNCLPNDILIKEVEDVNADFHARYDAEGKIYEYRILNQPLPSVFKRNYTYHIKEELDSAAMAEAAECLIGTYDFSSFQASGSNVQTTVRTIQQAEVTQQDRLVIFRIEGDGFLYNMVRIIVGTLIKVGTGEWEVPRMSRIIEAEDRLAAGPTAPAQGLRLIKVKY